MHQTLTPSDRPVDMSVRPTVAVVETQPPAKVRTAMAFIQIAHEYTEPRAMQIEDDDGNKTFDVIEREMPPFLESAYRLALRTVGNYFAEEPEYVEEEAQAETAPEA
jgi:hypothetical protein